MYGVCAYLIKTFCSFKGVHVQQKLAGCELMDNDTPGPMRSWDVFNGVLNAEWEFSTQQSTLQSAGLWTNFKKQAHQILYANIYTSVCIKTLKNCLHMWKNSIRRKGNVVILFNKNAYEIKREKRNFF